MKAIRLSREREENRGGMCATSSGIYVSAIHPRVI